jgi:hypothetical protein
MQGAAMNWHRVSDYAVKSDCRAYTVAKVIVDGKVTYEPYHRKDMLGDPTHDASEAKQRCADHEKGVS